MSQIADIRAAREAYDDLGFDTIPIAPSNKIPLIRGWQRRDSYHLWKNTPYNINIGIRTGNGLAVIDCDEKSHPGTFDHAVNLLAGLGYMPGEYPTVQTASGVGRHIYLSFAGPLPGDYRILSADFGMGEFRYGTGAYVCAPPSVITNGGAYALIDGDFRQLPKLTAADVLPILLNRDTTPACTPLRIPRNAWTLLQGKNLERYSSRSEAEQALIVMLVNAGHLFDSILALFLSNPCAGKFTELKTTDEKNAVRWLKHSYDNAVEWAKSHESKERRAARSLITWAESSPWPGRTGATDRAVFIAHASIARNASRLEYAASCRTLAELAGTTFQTANNSTRRLCAAGLLTLTTPAVADCANIFAITSQSASIDTSQVHLCEEVSSYALDVFRRNGLGKPAREVYHSLRTKPATVKELSAETGRHVTTIRRVLEKMENIVDGVTGEIVPMVEKDGDTWRALDVDLDQVARIIGMAGVGELQREKHAKDRRAHRRALEMGRRHGNTS